MWATATAQCVGDFTGLPSPPTQRLAPNISDGCRDRICYPSYETSPGIGWAFCRVCGSSLGIAAHGKLGEIALGALASDPGVRPTEHIFVGSKAEWFQITDTLPQYDKRPPGKTQ